MAPVAARERRSSRLLAACLAAFAVAAALNLRSLVADAFLPGEGRGRRGLFLAAAGSVVAPIWGAGAAGPPWSGKYSDPGHPGCKREVSVDGLKMKIDGGDEPCGPNDKQKAWSLTATLPDAEAKEVMIDFSPKGGPKDLKGKWDGGGIVFPDGNKWTKLK